MLVDKQIPCPICYDTKTSNPQFYVGHPEGHGGVLILRAENLKEEKDSKLHMICFSCFQKIAENYPVKCPTCRIHFSDVAPTLRELSRLTGQPQITQLPLRHNEVTLEEAQLIARLEYIVLAASENRERSAIEIARLVTQMSEIRELIETRTAILNARRTAIHNARRTAILNARLAVRLMTNNIIGADETIEQLRITNARNHSHIMRFHLTPQHRLSNRSQPTFTVTRTQAVVGLFCVTAVVAGIFMAFPASRE